jgi:hypothetical protein
MVPMVLMVLMVLQRILLLPLPQPPEQTLAVVRLQRQLPKGLQSYGRLQTFTATLSSLGVPPSHRPTNSQMSSNLRVCCIRLPANVLIRSTKLR